MATDTVQIGVGIGGLAIDQWRSFTDRIASIPIDTQILGLQGTTDHSEVLIDRLLRRSHDGVVVPTRYLPVQLPEEIEILAVTPRRTPESAFLSYDGIILDEFEKDAVIGVEGPIQAAQLMYYRPELRVVIVTGAVRYRLSRLEKGEIDALIVPAAWAEWLNIQELVSELLAVEIMMPLTGQGSLSLLGIKDDESLRPLATKLDDRHSRRMIELERATVEHLWEDQPVLASARAHLLGDTVQLDAMIIDAGGRHRYSHMMEGAPGESEEMAQAMADHLLALRGQEDD